MKSVQAETHEGSFKDFPIEDLLTLLAQQKRTGMLHLSTSGDRAIEVSFRDGRVCKAKRFRPKPNELFGNLLVSAGLITEQQRSRAVDEQRRTLKQLGEILVDSGALSREALRDFAALQTMEALFQPFEWTTGTWKFVAVEVGRDFEGLAPIECAAVVQEGTRRRAQWPSLRRRFHSNEASLRRLKCLPLPESPEFLKLQKKGISLGDRERCLYALAEPDRSIADIVARSRLGEFEALRALHTLCEVGLLKVVARGRSRSRGVSGGVGQRRDLRSVVNAFLYACLLVGLTALVGHLALQRHARRTLWPNEAAYREIVGTAQKSRLVSAIEAYRIAHGELPTDLSRLIETGYLQPGEDRYPFETPYGYSLQPGGDYLLLLPLR